MGILGHSIKKDKMGQKHETDYGFDFLTEWFLSAAGQFIRSNFHIVTIIQFIPQTLLNLLVILSTLTTIYQSRISCKPVFIFIMNQEEFATNTKQIQNNCKLILILQFLRKLKVIVNV